MSILPRAAPPSPLPGAAPRAPRVWLHLAFTGLISLLIAWLLTVFGRGSFGTALIYSSLIGALCWLTIDGGSNLLRWWLTRQRARAGLPPSQQPLVNGGLWYLLFVPLALVVGPWAGMALGDWITGQHSPRFWNFDSTTTRVTLTLTALASTAAVAVFSMLGRIDHARAEAEAARRAAAEHQLRLLQSQLEPHMLFNTLANLRVLIGLDAARAQAMLDHLIAFLRSTLQASRAATHPLRAEFDRSADYLALMQVRMGPRLRTQLHLPAELEAVQVPPLLLQPLLENSIQHGLEPKLDGGQVEVNARREGDDLVLSVSDTGLGLQSGRPSLGTGFGLQQVRERLATLHGEAASLRVEDAPGGGTLATVRLPWPSTQAVPQART